MSSTLRPSAARRADLISANGAVVTAFALTRATMAAVILGTAAAQGLDSERSALFFVQVAAFVAAGVGLVSAGRSLHRSLQKRPLFASHAWSLIALDAVLAIGVMAMIDNTTSPLAWVALITPVLEAAVLFSMVPAGVVWIGMSLAFLALRITTGSSDSTGSETLVLAIQQVLAVLLVSGPAALMADSAQQRIDQLADDRRQSDEIADRLRRVAEGAREMSQASSSDDVLALASRAAVSIGFDHSDVVLRSPDGHLLLHASHSNGSVEPMPLELLTGNQRVRDISSVTIEDRTHGDALRLRNVVSGHGVLLIDDDGRLETRSTQAILRVWSQRGSASEEDLRALALLGGHAREIHRAAQLLKQAQSHADQLLHEVRHDGLTGLANRAYLLETLEERISNREETALFFLDLDGFKSLNDTIGHRAGDAALITVGERLRGVARRESLVGRMGGDEFVIVMPLTQFDTIDSLRAFGESIEQSVSEPMIVDGHHAQLGASIGLAVHDGVLGADGLISQADHSMYEAKRAGGGVRVNPASIALFHEGKAAS